jgi:PAS domain S-box-containing protein
VTGSKDQSAAELRRRATERLAALPPRQDVDPVRLIHELEVHQIELELQNEELDGTRLELEAGLARYTELFEMAPIGYLVVDDHATIRVVNFAAADLLGCYRADLVGCSLGSFVGDRRRDVAHAVGVVLTQPAGDRTSETCEVTLVVRGRPPCDVRLTMTALAGDNSGVLVAIEDITARNRELAQQQERDRLLDVTRRDLEAMHRLHEIGMLFLPEGAALDVVFDKIIEAAVTLAGADFGDLQIFDRRTGAPRIRAQRNFAPWWVEFWNNASSDGVKGAALQRGSRVVVEDIDTSPLVGPVARAIKQRAGVRAVVATPLVSRSGKPLGTLSTHYKQRHRPDDRELQLLDLLSRQAADLIDHANAEAVQAALRQRFQALDRVSTLLTRYLTDGRERPLPDELFRDLAEVARSVCAADCAAVNLGADHWVVSGDGTITELQACVRQLEAVPQAERSVQHHVGGESFLATAIRNTTRLGWLCARKHSRDEFDAEDRETLEMLADRIAIGVEAVRLTRELGDALRGRDNLLAIVSHDLRSPLSAIRLSASYMSLTGPSGRSDEDRQVSVILRSAERMGRLIDDLLAAASIEAGKFTVAVSREDVLPIVQEAVGALEPLAKEKSIQLASEVAEGTPAISADRTRIIQVLTNLIGNAVKFIEPGGHVHVRAAPRGDSVQLAVSDDGPGIPEADRDRIFERYERGTARARNGLGLGLYIANGIVEAHRGVMCVASQPGAGATFYFTIPVAEESHAT